MNPKDLRIVFMGTPAMAAFSLLKLIQHGFNVVGVVTTPDKPAGRGLKLIASDVKKYAIEQNLLVLQPDKLKSPEFINNLQALKPDVQVVVAFRMLPEEVWKIPPLGSFNMHASLLPQYRGAAPINHAIINGEKETGVTTFLLDKEIDTGKILFQERLPIFFNETAGHLHNRIMETGAGLVIKTINEIAHGNINPIDQSNLVKYNLPLKMAPKIYKEDCLINFNKPYQQVVNLIHGLSPEPGAFTIINNGDTNLVTKIFEAQGKQLNHSHNSGVLFTNHKTKLAITTPDGFVFIKSLQVAGKRRMEIGDFLRGFRFRQVNLLQETD